MTADIRQMILGALAAGGGQHWLEKQMGANPVAFMGLVGKIIPQQIDATVRRELPEMTREQLLELLHAIPPRLAAPAEKQPVTIEHGGNTDSSNYGGKAS